MNTIKEIDKDIEKLKNICYDIYNKYKDNRLFKLLWDSRQTSLTYQFTMIGIDFGDKFIPDFLMGFSFLYEYHIRDDGGIRYNKEMIEKYNSLTLSEQLENEEPSFFTKEERNGYKGLLNGNGDSEEQIYDTCIKYLKEFCFYMIDSDTIDEEEKDLIEKYGYIIKKYLQKGKINE